MDKIGIIGQGYVGNALFQKCKNFFEILTYDKDESKSNSNMSEISKNCKIIFLCLPTPMNKDGSCDTSIIESVLFNLNKFKTKHIIVLKSTVEPKTTEKLN